MRKSVLLAVVIMLLVVGRSHAFDNGDFQVWNIDVLELKAGDKTKIAYEQEFRWGDNASKFYYQHYDLGASYSLFKYLSVGAGYRQIYELKNGQFKAENEPYIVGTLSHQLFGFGLEDRNRLEYRHFSYQDDAGRYRNKFTVKAPWKFTRLNIQPYISDEIFIGFGTITELNQNRFSPGFAMDITPNIKAELYYILVSAKSSGKWSDANVLGTKIKVVF